MHKAKIQKMTHSNISYHLAINISSNISYREYKT